MEITTKLLTMIIDLGTATQLTLGGFGTDLEFGFRPIQFEGKQ